MRSSFGRFLYVKYARTRRLGVLGRRVPEVSGTRLPCTELCDALTGSRGGGMRSFSPGWIRLGSLMRLRFASTKRGHSDPWRPATSRRSVQACRQAARCSRRVGFRRRARP